MVSRILRRCAVRTTSTCGCLIVGINYSPPSATCAKRHEPSQQQRREEDHQHQPKRLHPCQAVKPCQEGLKRVHLVLLGVNYQANRQSRKYQHERPNPINYGRQSNPVQYQQSRCRQTGNIHQITHLQRTQRASNHKRYSNRRQERRSTGAKHQIQRKHKYQSDPVTNLEYQHLAD